MDKKEKRVRPRPKSKVTQRRLNKRRPQDPFKTARNQTKAEEPISPTKRKMLDKQKQDQMVKQSLTQDYAYTGIPGAIAKPAGVTIRRKRSPMEKERVVDTMKSKFKGMIGDFKTAGEMKAATKGLDTLTDKGPGKLKLALRGGGRAYGKNS